MSSLDDAAFASAVAIDYALLEHSTRSVAAALTRADMCHITSAAGTDLVLYLRGRAAVEDNGDLRRSGAFGNLPAGEAYVAPLETCGEGSVVVDGSVAGYGLLRQPLSIAVQNGRVVSATGQAADWFLATLDAGNGQGGRTIAELGIGVNPGARVSGITILDEKALGTAHIAFGTNVSFGGVNSANVHIDCVLLAPTLDVDGQALIREGHSCW